MITDFFMLLSLALDIGHKLTPHKFSALADLRSPELIDECLTDTRIVTLRKRRLRSDSNRGHLRRELTDLQTQV